VYFSLTPSKTLGIAARSETEQMFVKVIYFTTIPRLFQGRYSSYLYQSKYHNSSKGIIHSFTYNRTTF